MVLMSVLLEKDWFCEEEDRTRAVTVASVEHPSRVPSRAPRSCHEGVPGGRGGGRPSAAGGSCWSATPTASSRPSAAAPAPAWRCTDTKVLWPKVPGGLHPRRTAILEGGH